ncbi:hypothetical protein BM536_038955 [Streptomyces phaeoluteigriseus]|uniref:Apolipoprotein N-acyltransferase n=1 Tax=Streptomyces phaeoluteigriseus TaxID=114686 RepID=A0A1V6MGQ7_9ACTN|nr:hypothetical protein BM536_038955 [Streptomyces phaeoluteigriseus]
MHPAGLHGGQALRGLPPADFFVVFFTAVVFCSVFDAVLPAGVFFAVFLAAVLFFGRSWTSGVVGAMVWSWLWA